MQLPRIYSHSFFRGNRAVKWNTKRDWRLRRDSDGTPYQLYGWYYALGWVKPDMAIYEWPPESTRRKDGSRRPDHIDALGGGGWLRLGPRPSPLFLCRYRCK